MTRLLRTELLKLRTTRLPCGLLAAAAGLTMVLTLLGATQAGKGAHAPPALDTATGLTDVLTGTGFGMLMAMVLGVTVASGEFRHRTATATYLASPNRVSVLIAKALAAAGVGLVFGLVASAVTSGIGLAFVAAKGYQLALGAATIARFAAGATLGSGLLAAIGVAAGSLIRSQLGAIITVFAWGLVVEQILGGLFNSIQPYLPNTAAMSMAGASLKGGTTPLPFAAAALLIADVAVVISVVAARTTLPRDIS